MCTFSLSLSFKICIKRQLERLAIFTTFSEDRPRIRRQFPALKAHSALWILDSQIIAQLNSLVFDDNDGGSAVFQIARAVPTLGAAHALNRSPPCSRMYELSSPPLRAPTGSLTITWTPIGGAGGTIYKVTRIGVVGY